MAPSRRRRLVGELWAPLGMSLGDLPAEGASDVAYAVFSFPSLAEYERYRERFGVVLRTERRP